MKWEKKVLYEGKIRGLVKGESRINVVGPGGYGPFEAVYFTIKLEERIGIGGIPDEILVFTSKSGYFRIGDKVILQGQIVKENLKRWGRPDYLIEADHYYNESLQSGA